MNEEVVLEETKGEGVCRLERFRVRVLLPLRELLAREPIEEARELVEELASIRVMKDVEGSGAGRGILREEESLGRIEG